MLILISRMVNQVWMMALLLFNPLQSNLPVFCQAFSKAATVDHELGRFGDRHLSCEDDQLCPRSDDLAAGGFLDDSHEHPHRHYDRTQRATAHHRQRQIVPPAPAVSRNTGFPTDGFDLRIRHLEYRCHEAPLPLSIAPRSNRRYRRIARGGLKRDRRTWN